MTLLLPLLSSALLSFLFASILNLGHDTTAPLISLSALLVSTPRASKKKAAKPTSAALQRKRAKSEADSGTEAHTLPQPLTQPATQTTSGALTAPHPAPTTTATPGLTIQLPPCTLLPPSGSALSPPPLPLGDSAAVLYDLSGVVCHKGKSLTQVRKRERESNGSGLCFQTTDSWQIAIPGRVGYIDAVQLGLTPGIISWQGHYISYVKKEIRLPSEEIVASGGLVLGGTRRKQTGTAKQRTKVVWLK